MALPTEEGVADLESVDHPLLEVVQVQVLPTLRHHVMQTEMNMFYNVGLCIPGPRGTCQKTGL